MEPVAFVLGALLLALTFWDLFQTVVVPRPTPGWFRIGRYSIRGSWRVLRAIRDGGRGRSVRPRSWGSSRRRPRSCLLAAWLVGLIVGYGLVLFALRDELSPLPTDLGTTVYFAATSVLTLGFGDIVADGALARILGHGRRDRGLGAVALVVTFLFSLYGSYQRREVGSSPSRRPPAPRPRPWRSSRRMPSSTSSRGCRSSSIDWERWAAEVLDSHVAYPAPRVLPLEPRQPVVDQRPRHGPRRRRASCSRRSTEIPRGEAKLFKRWARISSRTSSTSASAPGSRGPRARGVRCRLRSPCRRGLSPRPGGQGMAPFRGRAGHLFASARGDGQLLGDRGNLVAGDDRGPQSRRRTPLSRHPLPGDARELRPRAAAPLDQRRRET